MLAITPERARKYHHEPAAQMTGLLAPLDGSELAEAVLPYVERLALAMQLRVTLVKALRLDSSSSAYLEGMAYATDAKIQLEVEQESSEYLGEIASALRDKGVKVDTRVILGTPASAIADMAHEHDYDIIAMATHGRSGISRWVLGSVTETLVRTSGNPRPGGAAGGVVAGDCAPSPDGFERRSVDSSDSQLSLLGGGRGLKGCPCKGKSCSIHLPKSLFTISVVY